MPEGGREVVEELLQVGVVLLVPLVGVKRFCTGGSTARPSGGGALRSSTLWSSYSSGGNWNWFAR
jgi:hypothetical protein